MENSIFPVLSIDPDESKWEDHLFDLTPVEKIGEMWFKREDKFAPLGYGGINGSKLRQAIWLVLQEANKRSPIMDCLVSGASIKSPQLPMSSAVAYHFGYNSLHVIGATRPDTCMSKDMVKMATMFGAKFCFLKVGYNPVLQGKVDKIIESDPEKLFKLNYGITIDENCEKEKIVEFHLIGANQVKNIPDNIENLIIPSGSCNSAISILFGLSKFKPKNLKNVYLIGIGPKKLKFINERLSLIKLQSGVNTLNFNLGFETDELKSEPDLNPYNIKYFDIHSIPKYDYQNEVKFSYNGVNFHPTYEGKVMDYVTKNLPELICDKTMLWIVGSKPTIEPMLPNLTGFSVPEKPLIYSNDWE